MTASAAPAPAPTPAEPIGTSLRPGSTALTSAISPGDRRADPRPPTGHTQVLATAHRSSRHEHRPQTRWRGHPHRRWRLTPSGSNRTAGSI